MLTSRLLVVALPDEVVIMFLAKVVVVSIFDAATVLSPETSTVVSSCITVAVPSADP